MTSYRALALQTRCTAVNAAPDPRAVMKETIERIAGQIRAGIAFIGRDLRLVVLPEYVLTGYPMGEPIDVWADRAAVDPGGAEYEALGAVAHEHGIFLCGNAYERDPNFPGMYFQASFVLGPAGDVLLRYHRLNSMFTPTPHDVYDRYVDLYGPEAIFPVARTEIGNLAAVASEEILFPELSRCLAVKGAEIILHPTSEAGAMGVTAKDAAKRARAVENVAYVISANTAGIEGSSIPGGSTDGKSQIVDYEGRVLVQAGYGESMVAFAEIDLDALRRARRRPGMMNLLARNRFDLYAPVYAQARFHEANGLSDGRPPDRTYFMESHRAVIERLSSDGVI